MQPVIRFLATLLTNLSNGIVKIEWEYKYTFSSGKLISCIQLHLRFWFLSLLLCNLAFRSLRYYPVDTGRKLNVHKTFRRRPGRLMYVQITSYVRPCLKNYISSLNIIFIMLWNPISFWFGVFWLLNIFPWII